MGKVGFWGRSYAQFRSLPAEIQIAFEWAILESAADPASFPESRDTRLVVVTESMCGPSGLRRIKVTRSSEDPGFRGIYFFDGSEVNFLRFSFRDPDTYRRIDRELTRLLASLK